MRLFSKVISDTGAVWGQVTGTLSNQSDLSTAINAKAPAANPVFTGIVTLPANTLAAASDTLTMTNAPAGSAGDPAAYAVIQIGSTHYFFPLWAVPAMMMMSLGAAAFAAPKKSLTSRVLTRMKKMLSFK